MRKTKKVFLIIFLISLLSIMLIPTKAHAALQSNGNSAVTKNFESWLLQIRQMQSAGGTLGLSDTINTSDLSSNNTNLDIHMEKNTEYGGYVLLSASAYGNPNKITDGQTTTGNATGIVMKINGEWTASGSGLNSSALAKSAKGRYIVRDYTPNYNGSASITGSTHVGDAINTGSWHGASNNGWLTWETSSALVRAYSGSIFSYNGTGRDGAGRGSVYDGIGYYKTGHYSRAIVVVGAGV